METLEEVARVYCEPYFEGRSVRDSVAERFRIARDTATKRIKLARDAGLLGGVGPRRADRQEVV